MEVWLHEPGEGLEVYELYVCVWGWISEYRLDPAAFLAVAGEGAGGVEGWGDVREGERRGLLGEDEVEFLVILEEEAPCVDVFADLVGANGDEDRAGVGDTGAYMGWGNAGDLSEGAGAADGAAKDLGEGPGEIGDIVEGETGVAAGVPFRGVAGHVFDSRGLGDHRIYGS